MQKQKTGRDVQNTINFGYYICPEEGGKFLTTKRRATCLDQWGCIN